MSMTFLKGKQNSSQNKTHGKMHFTGRLRYNCSPLAKKSRFLMYCSENLPIRKSLDDVSSLEGITLTSDAELPPRTRSFLLTAQPHEPRLTLVTFYRLLLESRNYACAVRSKAA
jgi:hypothetical protein